MAFLQPRTRPEFNCSSPNIPQDQIHAMIFLHALTRWADLTDTTDLLRRVTHSGIPIHKPCYVSPTLWQERPPQ